MAHKKQISPSLMCADLLNLGAELKLLEKAGIEYLHIDIMDGVYVPNYTLGTDYCRNLKKVSKIPLDIHLMIVEPERKLDWFEFGEGDYVSVHVESTRHLQRTLAAIRRRGAKPMVALNPATPLCSIEDVLDDIDAVLIMTVNPGYAGQKLVPATLDKIRRLRKMLDETGHQHVEIEVDGNVNFPNAIKMRDAGANIYVAGSSSVFDPTLTLEEGIAKLRENI